MDIATITLLIVAGISILLAIGVPLAFATGVIAMATALLAFGPMGLTLVASRTYTLVSEFLLVAVPMFILMAAILERSGVAHDLFRAMHLLGGGLRGGLGLQTLAVAVVMAAMTGIIGGEIVILGLIALPQMLNRGYNRRLAMGIVCAGGSLGTMIPPSIVLIIYGLTANVSIGDLFVASLLPGLMLAGLYASYVLLRCHLDPSAGPPAPPEERDLDTAEKLRLVRGLVLPCMVIVFVLGTIYSGIASVSEAAAIGVVGAIASALVRRELSWPMLRDALYRTMSTSGLLLWLTIGANALIGVYNLLGGARFIQQTIVGLPLEPIEIILLMMLILIVLGLFIDWIGIVLLTMPIFVPIVEQLGYSAVWFGVLFCMNMQISYLSPPFGPACFYLKSVAPPDIQLGEIFKAMWPFIALQAVGLMLVLFNPIIALWLPELLYG